jgi:riboflavin transporter FmnP
MVESPVPNRTVTLTGAAVFAALAALLTLARAQIPFPPIPYLQVDFAEIPILMAFFLFGPVSACIAAVIQWIFLNVQGGDAPVGPMIKFMAEFSTIAGLWLGNAFYRRVSGKRISGRAALSVMLSAGVLLRVLAMTVANYLVLVYVAPLFLGVDYLGFARAALEQFTGWRFQSDEAVLVYTLVFTALYNVVNLLVAAVPAGFIVSPIAHSFKAMTSIDAWLARNLRSSN